MRNLRILAVLLSLGSVAAAQGVPSQTSKSATGAAKKPVAKAAKDSSAGSQPVITIENLCPPRQPKPTPCSTVVTKDDFERVIKVVGPNLPPGRRMQVASRYADLLTFANQAEQAGLDKTPQFQQEMEQLRRDLQEESRLRRLQALAMAYDGYLRAKYGKVSDAEVEKYYNENKAAYEEITLKRVFVRKVHAQADKKPALDEAATKALAEKLRERAAAGEDIDKLQQEATAAVTPEAANLPTPVTGMGARRRGSLPPDQEPKIFELSAGQASPVFEEPSGFFIYKVETKRVLPLEGEVKTQISRQLEEQSVRDAIEKTARQVKTKFDESYFKPPEPAKAPNAAPAPPAAPAQAAPAAAAGGDKGTAKEAAPAATPPAPPQQTTSPPSGPAPAAPPK